jgi:glycosyltransferase involved in cell wall biosynthesis
VVAPDRRDPALAPAGGHGREERVKISACVIAKDEADRIGPCLESLRFCDEVVVLDSGSTDGTQDIVRRMGVRLVETDWPGWIAQKNRAVDAAQHDWILSLDSDERLDPPLRAELERIRALHDPSDGTVAYEMTRKVHYLGRWILHGGWYPEWRVRLFDRRRARWGGMDPHDRVEPRGEVVRIATGNIEHYTYRSISDHLARLNRFTSVAAKELFDRGRRARAWSLLMRPPWHAFQAYVLKAGFLDGVPGLVMAVLRGVYSFLKYAKLWEMTRVEAARTR